MNNTISSLSFLPIIFFSKFYSAALQIFNYQKGHSLHCYALKSSYLVKIVNVSSYLSAWKIEISNELFLHVRATHQKQKHVEIHVSLLH